MTTLRQETAMAIYNNKIDLYEVLIGRETCGTAEEDALIAFMYNDIGIEGGYNPDDDFESILDIMYDRIVADFRDDILSDCKN